MQEPTCAHPHLEATTGYSYGCRCARCAEGVRSYKQSIRSGRTCATPSCSAPITTPSSRWCDACRVGHGRCQYADCTEMKTRGSGVRYCELHRYKQNRPRELIVRFTCSLCDCPVLGTSRGNIPRYEVCSACIEPVKGLARRAARHGVPKERFVQWARDPRCELCATPLLGGSNSSQYAIDHDHGHCPGSEGCELCVRGLLCSHCNLALGTYERMLTTHGALALCDYLRRAQVPAQVPAPPPRVLRI